MTMTMRCPHCKDDISTVTRTGDDRYGCGSCNKIISYSSLKPYLEDSGEAGLEVIDRRDLAAQIR